MHVETHMPDIQNQNNEINLPATQQKIHNKKTRFCQVSDTTRSASYQNIWDHISDYSFPSSRKHGTFLPLNSVVLLEALSNIEGNSL